MGLDRSLEEIQGKGSRKCCKALGSGALIGFDGYHKSNKCC